MHTEHMHRRANGLKRLVGNNQIISMNRKPELSIATRKFRSHSLTLRATTITTNTTNTPSATPPTPAINACAIKHVRNKRRANTSRREEFNDGTHDSECSINEASTTKAIIIFPAASLTDNLIAGGYLWGGGTREEGVACSHLAANIISSFYSVFPLSSLLRGQASLSLSHLVSSSSEA